MSLAIEWLVDSRCPRPGGVEQVCACLEGIIIMAHDFPDDLEATTWVQTSIRADFQFVVFFFSFSMI